LKLKDQRRIRQLENEIDSISFKICNRVLQGKNSGLTFVQTYKKIVKKQAEIYAIKWEYGLYRRTNDQNYEFF